MAKKHHEENDVEHSEAHKEHMSIFSYILVFLVLVVGTILTFVTAQYDLDVLFPGANTLLALIIAFTKMTFVVLFFMHVYWQSRLIWLTAVAGFFWIAIMFAYTMQDYLTRSAGTFGH
jgi:cytochrome c oxidase subunit 4